MTTSDTSTPVCSVLSLADLEAFDPQAASGGTERVSRCPHCQSTERAFHFNTITGLYNCKRASCGVSGKLSDFWQERPKQSRRERARNALHSAFSLQNPKSASMPAKAAQHEKLAQPATAQTWQEYFGQAQPANGTAAIQYLMQRGIPDTITESAGARFLSIRGRDFVVFPFCNLAGAPVAFQARALDSTANPHRAYGRKRAGVFLTCADALQAETVIVCEAPIDAMSLTRPKAIGIRCCRQVA